MSELNLTELPSIACKFGAADAKLISVSDIVVADWVPLKCQYGCNSYGQYLTCPPYSPKPDVTRKILSNYTSALILKFLPPPPDFNWSITHDITIKFEREMFLRGFYSAFAYISGHCHQCTKCNLKSCAHPDLARPSMESSGMDVFATVRKAGFEIKVVTSEKEQPTYYTLVLIR